MLYGDNQKRVSIALQQLKSDFRPRKSVWHHIGYVNGRKVFITEFSLHHPYYDFTKFRKYNPEIRPVYHRKPFARKQRCRSLIPDNLFGDFLRLLLDLWHCANGRLS